MEYDCSTCPIKDIAPVPGAEELVGAFIRGKQLRILSPHISDIEMLEWKNAGVLDDTEIYVEMELGWSKAVVAEQQKAHAKNTAKNVKRRR